MTHTCSSSPWEAEAGEAHKFHTSLGYIARPCLNTKTKELIQGFLSFLHLVSWIVYWARRKELCSIFRIRVSSIYFNSSVLFKKQTQLDTPIILALGRLRHTGLRQALLQSKALVSKNIKLV